MDVIISRLSEPSTYAGFSGLALAFGVSEPLYSAISVAAAGVFGLIAVILKEKKGAPK